MRILLALWAALCAMFLASCNENLRTVDQMLGFAAAAIEANNSKALFRAIDERSRFAMDSIVSDRTKSSKIIMLEYPSDAKEVALAQLGDASTVESAAELFMLRCEETCMREFRSTISPRVAMKNVGDEILVLTDKGKEVRVFAGSSPKKTYGIVWRLQELSEERTKANRDLRTITENAQIYRKRRDLGSL